MAAQSIDRAVPNVAKTAADKLTDQEVIGQGAFGQVFKSFHQDWGDVAYKRLSTGTEYIEERFINDLLKEVESHSKLKHPNLVQMMAMVYEPMKECGIVLWYEPYGNMDQFLHKYRVPWQWKVEMMCHVALGMNYLHTQSPPIIHGDLKIQNVLVGEGFVAKISDFGLSVWKNYTSMKTHTAKSLQGTVTHIAPERLKDVHLRLNEKADVYSYAILVWEMFAEKHPFSGTSPIQICAAVVMGQRPQLEEIANVGEAEELREIISAAWSQEPQSRPSSEDIMKMTRATQSRLNKDICFAKLKLQNQDGLKKTGHDLSAEPLGLPALPIQPVSSLASADGVDHEGVDANTNPGCPVPCGSTGQIHPVQVQDNTKGHSSGYAFRHGHGLAGRNTDCGTGIASLRLSDSAGASDSPNHPEVSRNQRRSTGSARLTHSQTVPCHIRGEYSGRPAVTDVFPRGRPPVTHTLSAPSTSTSLNSMTSTSDASAVTSSDVPVEVSSTMSSLSQVSTVDIDNDNDMIVIDL